MSNAEVTPVTTRFAEYELFDLETDEQKAAREEQNALFRAGKVTNPHFEYPKLTDAPLVETLDEYELAIRAAANPIEQNRLEDRKKGVFIALSSLALAEAPTHTARRYAGTELTDYSESRYGSVDRELFWDVVQERACSVEYFVPGNDHARLIRDRVFQLMPKTGNSLIIPGLTAELLNAIHPVVMEHVQPLLDCIPKEGKFTSDEIVTLATHALEAVGLAEKGWKAVKKPTSTFSTNSAKKEIIVPNPNEDFTRNAADLRRLFGHEIGVHAMKQVPLDDEFEEGLGLLVESAIVGKTDNAAITRAKNRYLSVGLATGADGVPRTARQVFEITWRLEAIKLAKDGIITPEIEAKAKKTMQSHIDNIYRGTDHALPGVVYTKAKIYLEGIDAAAGYADTYKDDPNWLKKLLKEGPVAA